MKQSNNIALYVALFAQIVRMHEEVGFRRHLNSYQGQRGKQKDYPSVSVGAQFHQASAIGHHHSYSIAQDFHPLVLQKLSLLGNLNDFGINYPLCANRVGHCAENYAASSVMKIIDPNGDNHDTSFLGSICFTKAFSPRTLEEQDWCSNCHTMFD